MSNLHPVFEAALKPFYSTGLTTEQRLTIADELNVVIAANTKILEIINEMDDERKALGLIKATEKIGTGCKELLMNIK